MPLFVWFPVLAGLAIGYSFMNIPPIADQFMGMFGVGYAGLSFFLSGLLWSHSALQIPAGLIIDRFGTVKCIAFSCLLGIACNLLPLAMPSHMQLGVAARFMLGITTSTLFLCMMKIIALLAPPDEAAKAQGYYGGAFGFGTMLPYVILPYLGEAAWIHAYVQNAALYIVVLVCLFFIPRAKFSRTAVIVKEGIGVWDIVRVAAASPEVWALGLAHGAAYGTLTNLGQWLPSILADQSGTMLSEWNLAAVLLIFVGSSSRMISGNLLRYASRAGIINGSLVLLFVMYVVLGQSANAHATLVLGLVLAAIAGANFGSIFTLGGRILEPVYLATALGLLNSVANFYNVFLTLLFGFVREHTGSFAWAFTATGISTLGVFFALRKMIKQLDERIG